MSTKKVSESSESVLKGKAGSWSRALPERAQLCMQDMESPLLGARAAPAGASDYALGPSARCL